MNASIEDRIADTYDTARCYLDALDAVTDADPKDLGAAQADVAPAFHDLALAVRGECRMCDAGTCPGYVTTSGPRPQSGDIDLAEE